MLVATSTLTSGEKLVIQRRRDGSTQAKAARAHKVTQLVYRGWERDSGERIPRAAVGKISESEQCFVLRRRSGMTLDRLAGRLRVCRYWLRQMEAGTAPVARLAEYWSKKK